MFAMIQQFFQDIWNIFITLFPSTITLPPIQIGCDSETYICVTREENNCTKANNQNMYLPIPEPS